MPDYDLLSGLNKEATQLTVLDKLQEIADNTNGLEVSLGDVDLNTDELETKLEDIKTKLDALNADLDVIKNQQIDGTQEVKQGTSNHDDLNAWVVKLSDGADPVGTETNPLRIDPTGDTVQPVSVSSLPLPTGAATETTLASLETQQTDGSQRTKLYTNGMDVDSAHPLPVAATFSDENGVPYSDANPLPVSVGDLTIESLTVTFPDSVLSTVNSTSTPLAANGTFIGAWEEVMKYSAISAIIITDAASATNGAIVDFSDDGVTPIRSAYATIPANTGLSFIFAPEGRYFRIRYTNGAVPQTTLRSQVILHYQTPVVAQLPMAATTTDLNIGNLAQAHLKGRHSSGVWIPVSVTNTGVVNVTGTVTATPTGTQDVNIVSSTPLSATVTQGTSPWIVSGALTDTQLRASPVDVADSGEVEYSPGLFGTTVTSSGDTVVYTATLGSAFVIHFTYAVPVTRGAEDPPVITIKILNSDNSVFATPYVVAAVSQRKRITGPINGKIAVNLDIGARVPVTFDIEEI